jgi:hypothetical protein
VAATVVWAAELLPKSNPYFKSNDP